MVSEYDIGKSRVELHLGNVLIYKTDAIVFPVDPMLGYKGMNGSLQSAIEDGNHFDIFEEAGKIAQAKLKEGSLDSVIPMAVPIGSVHVTSAGKLDAKNAFHAVILAYEKDANDEYVKRTYATAQSILNGTRNSLELAAEKEFQSIAFPLFGGSVYRISIGQAVEAMAQQFEEHLKSAETSLEKISLVVPLGFHYMMARKVFENKFH